MRSALLNRELAGLCASCAQGALAPRMYSTTTALASPRRAATWSSQSRPQSQSRSQSQAQRPRRVAAQAPQQRRRWLSGSTALRSEGSTTSPAQQQQEQEEGERQRKTTTTTKTGHKPLPYYALFPQTLPDGAPPDGPFDIDVRALRREFLQLQAASHPDYHHSAQTDTTDDSSSSSSPSSHSEPRRRAEALSSHINAAYRTLSSPLLRAQYILAERHGVDLAGDEASRVSGPADAALLAEVMHAREAVEDARAEGDLEALSAENDARIRDAVAALARALEAGDVGAAVGEAVRLRYWENIRESVRDWEAGGSGALQH